MTELYSELPMLLQVPCGMGTDRQIKRNQDQCCKSISVLPVRSGVANSDVN